MARFKQERPKRKLFRTDAEPERSDAPGSRSRKRTPTKRRKVTVAESAQASTFRVPISSSCSLTEVAEVVFAAEERCAQILRPEAGHAYPVGSSSEAPQLHFRIEQNANTTAAVTSELDVAAQLDGPCLLYVGCSPSSTKSPQDLVRPSAVAFSSKRIVSHKHIL